MRRHPIVKILKVMIVVAVFIAIFSFVVMKLWNWLMPGLFGLQGVTYWQAMGILVLSRILFGGFRGRPGRPPWHWRQRMVERWQSMSPEEREKFRQGLENRWGPFGPTEPKK
jgi:Ca2+/H+ antiporter, TMEM165/GDT1 family